MLSALILTTAIGQYQYAVTPAGAILGQEALCLAAAPAGTRFAAGMADRSVKIFDAKTRQTIATWKGHNFPPLAVAWSPKGDRIASGSENAEIRIWDVKTGNSVSIKGTHLRAINALWFNAQGTRLISTSDDDSCKVWDLSTRKAILTIKGNGQNIYGSRFDPTGKLIVAGTLAKGLIIYDGTTGAPKKSYGGHLDSGVNDIDLNPAGTLAATAGRDTTVGIWDLKKGKRISYLRGHTDWVTRVKFDPSGRFLLSSSSDASVRVWDVKALKSIWRIDKMSMTGSPLAWLDGGNFIVTVGDDNYLRLFKLARYK